MTLWLPVSKGTQAIFFMQAVDLCKRMGSHIFATADESEKIDLPRFHQLQEAMLISGVIQMGYLSQPMLHLLRAPIVNTL